MLTRSGGRIRLVLACALALCVAAAGSFAASESAPSAGSEGAALDEEAEEVLQSVSEYYSGLDSVKVDATLTLVMTSQDMKQEVDQDITLAAVKPNSLRLEITRGMLGGAVTSDGETMYAYFPDENAYIKQAAPSDFDDLNASPLMSMMASRTGGRSFLLPLLHSDPYAALTRDVQQGTYEGTEDVGEVTCHHLSFAQKELDWQAWVAEGEEPVVEKIRVDLSKTFQQASSGNQAFEDMEVISTLDLTKQTANPDIAAASFAFSPPEGATEYGSIVEMIRDKMQGQSQQGQSSLLGKEAPQFTVDKLDGTSVSLSDHKGQDVVLLDFWATWCPPCRKAMPKIEALSEQYADQSVVVYAVNQQEGAEKVRQFMEQQDLDLTVLLDKSGSIGSNYGVRGIPTTVLIGKDGTVQATHSGYSPTMQDMLSSQIDKLLAGQSLVESGE